MIAATVAFAIGVAQEGWETGWIEGMSIYIAVVIIVTVTSGNNYVKELQFQKLMAKGNEDYVAVYRGGLGDTKTISIENLVVGDVIKLE